MDPETFAQILTTITEVDEPPFAETNVRRALRILQIRTAWLEFMANIFNRFDSFNQIQTPNLFMQLPPPEEPK